jgi:hypothetical protein
VHYPLTTTIDDGGSVRQKPIIRRPPFSLAVRLAIPSVVTIIVTMSLAMHETLSRLETSNPVLQQALFGTTTEDGRGPNTRPQK